MRSRNIPAYFPSKKESKLEVLHRIMDRYNMKPDNLIYIGNKLTDIPCMNYADSSFSLTHTSLIGRVRSTANHLLNAGPGEGILSELVEILSPEMEKRIRKT